MSLENEIKHFAEKIDVSPEKLDQRLVFEVLKHTAKDQHLNEKLLNSLNNYGHEKKITAEEIEKFFVNFCKGLQFFYEKTGNMVAKGIHFDESMSEDSRQSRLQVIYNVPVMSISVKYVEDKIRLLQGKKMKGGNISTESYVAMLGATEAFCFASEVKYGKRIDNYNGIDFENYIKEARSKLEKPTTKIKSRHLLKQDSTIYLS